MGKNIEISEKIEKYINNFSFKLSPVQKEIIDYNNTLGNEKRMQVAISQCHFLHLIIKISNIKNVLEIGTFTGLSTLSMALALPDNGKIITLDKDEQTNKIAVDFFKRSHHDHKIKTIIKPALETLIQIRKEKFDLIFIDADKMNYKKYYQISLELLNNGGLIIIDNVLWHGEVADKSINDKYTKNIRELNDFISKDIRVEKVIVPFGDGMTVCRKI